MISRYREPLYSSYSQMRRLATSWRPSLGIRVSDVFSHLGGGSTSAHLLAVETVVEYQDSLLAGRLALCLRRSLEGVYSAACNFAITVPLSRPFMVGRYLNFACSRST